MNKIKYGVLAAILGLLAGCAGTTSLTAPSSNSPASNINKGEFLMWSNGCNTYAGLEYGAIVAIAGKKLNVSAFPYIKATQTAITPLCKVFPSNYTVAMSSIDTAITDLGLGYLENKFGN